jgi:uncharacterized C2H2 Zn-finger protein
MTLPEALRRAIGELLACPRCGGSLRAEEAAARCTTCDAVFRVTDGVLDFVGETPPDRDDNDTSP